METSRQRSRASDVRSRKKWNVIAKLLVVCAITLLLCDETLAKDGHTQGEHQYESQNFDPQGLGNSEKGLSEQDDVILVLPVTLSIPSTDGTVAQRETNIHFVKSVPVEDTLSSFCSEHSIDLAACEPLLGEVQRRIAEKIALEQQAVPSISEPTATQRVRFAFPLTIDSAVRELYVYDEWSLEQSVDYFLYKHRVSRSMRDDLLGYALRSMEKATAHSNQKLQSSDRGSQSSQSPPQEGNSEAAPENTSPAAEGAAESGGGGGGSGEQATKKEGKDPYLLVDLDVNVDEERTVKFKLMSNEDPSEASIRFCLAHNISLSSLDQLQSAIMQRVEIARAEERLKGEHDLSDEEDSELTEILEILSELDKPYPEKLSELDIIMAAQDPNAFNVDETVYCSIAVIFIGVVLKLAGFRLPEDENASIEDEEIDGVGSSSKSAAGAAREKKLGSPKPRAVPASPPVSQPSRSSSPEGSNPRKQLPTEMQESEGYRRLLLVSVLFAAGFLSVVTVRVSLAAHSLEIPPLLLGLQVVLSKAIVVGFSLAVSLASEESLKAPTKLLALIRNVKTLALTLGAAYLAVLSINGVLQDEAASLEGQEGQGLHESLAMDFINSIVLCLAFQSLFQVATYDIAARWKALVLGILFICCPFIGYPELQPLAVGGLWGLVNADTFSTPSKGPKSKTSPPVTLGESEDAFAQFSRGFLLLSATLGTDTYLHSKQLAGGPDAMGSYILLLYAIGLVLIGRALCTCLPVIHADALHPVIPMVSIEITLLPIITQEVIAVCGVENYGFGTAITLAVCLTLALAGSRCARDVISMCIWRQKGDQRK